MSGIETVRASVEKKLEALEHQAEALEAQLTQTREQVLDRLEEGKRQLRDLVTSVRQELSDSPDVVDQVKAELQTALDQPQVQTLLTLLRSEAWRAQLNAIPGYAAEGSGEVLSLRRVLPWWSYRKPKR